MTGPKRAQMYLSAESSRLRSADTTITPTTRSLPVAQARLLLAARSVEHAGGEHKAGGCPRRGFTAVTETRSVQAAPRRCRRGGLGCPTVGDDPSHYRLRVSAFGHDRRPLDDGAAGGMSSRQSGDHRQDRVVVHACHRSPFHAVAQGAGMADRRSARLNVAKVARGRRKRPAGGRGDSALRTGSRTRSRRVCVAGGRPVVRDRARTRVPGSSTAASAGRPADALHPTACGSATPSPSRLLPVPFVDPPGVSPPPVTSSPGGRAD